MAASATVSRRPAGAPWVVPTVAVAAAAAAVVAARGTGVRVTSYAETSPLALGADLGAGLAMMAAGVAVRLAYPAGIALVAVLIGGAWSASDWIGAEQAPAAVRSVAMVLAPFLPALVAHLALAWPEGRLRGAARTAVAVAYAATAAIALGQAVVRDPLFDRYCWQNCTDNVFLVHADVDAARVLATLIASTTIGIALLLASAVLLRGGPKFRLRSGPVLPLAAGVTAAEAAYALLRLVDPVQEPSAGPFPGLFVLRAGALVTLAAALAVPAVRSLRSRIAVQRLAQDLASAPASGRLRAVLAERLGDDRLEVAYWLDHPRRLVDARGASVDLAPAPTQVVTTITRGGRAVAEVVHDRSLREQAEPLQKTIGSAARLAVDNERLRAEVRRLAHGIFPAILTDAGLAPALRTFAAGAVLPVEVLEVAQDRCCSGAETAAYVVVVEAVVDAARRSAAYAAVQIRREDRLLTVVVADDGTPAEARLFVRVTDRVEALGGRLLVGPDGVRAEIPCG